MIFFNANFSDSKGKYKLFERATHMDAMKREFSEGEENLKRSKTCVKDKKEVKFVFNLGLYSRRLELNVLLSLELAAADS